MAVVKANGYGHGMAFVAKTLAPHVDAFAVATLDEAIALRKLMPRHPITCLSGWLDKSQINVFKENAISPVLFDEQQVVWLQKVETFSIPLWLKVDTGMGRLGIAPSLVPDVLKHLVSLDFDVRLMSHFASADNPKSAQNKAQSMCFTKVIAQENNIASIANSAAILTRPTDHFDWVRPGIMLYGASPLAGQSANSLNLKSVMRFKARLLAIKKLQMGDTVGYGAHYVAKKNVRLGIVSAGYADGYPRMVSKKAQVYIKGHYCPIIGRVSMDTLAVDLSDTVAVCQGDCVELWGDNMAIEKVADWASTIQYELMCKVATRVVRKEVH